MTALAQASKNRFHGAPWRLILLRLSRHRLAMAGLAIDVVVLALIVFGGRLVDTRAGDTRLWIGAQPPGFSHPHCLDEMVLQTGETARLGGRLERCSQVVYHLRKTTLRQFRIVLRRGVVQGITVGAEALDALDLAAFGSAAFELLEDGSRGRTLSPVRLRVGDPPLEGLFADGQRVLFIAWEERGEPMSVEVGLVDGTVRSLVVEDEAGRAAVASAIVRGEHVEWVLGDGRKRVLRHPLGTDELGRDLFLRIVSGGRISLLVAVVATLVSLLIGVAYGAIAGYAGGRLDAVMMRLVDILYGLPFIFLVLLLMVVFNRNIILLFAALGLVQWLTMARIVRGQILSLKEREFIEAAKMAGASTFGVIAYHLLPHVLGPVVVYATLTVPVVILEESFLAFIGLPVQYQGTTLDSWGSLVHLGMSALGESGQKWWLLFFPSLAMVATLFGLNCFGDGLRDSLDPKCF